MAKPRHLKLAVALAAIIACGWLGWRLFALPVIPSHRGDGVFRDLSRREPFANRGYDVSMPEFDLAEPHQAEYRLAGLTDIGRKCGVHLAIRNPEGRLWWEGAGGQELRADGGELRLELLDATGLAIVSVHGTLGDYTWSGYAHLQAVSLYQSDKSFFMPDSKEEYRLRVSYSPDRKLAGCKGFVYVRCGATK